MWYVGFSFVNNLILNYYELMLNIEIKVLNYDYDGCYSRLKILDENNNR